MKLPGNIDKIKFWTYCLFLGAVFGIPRSIAFAETLLFPCFALFVYYHIKERRLPALPLIGWIIPFIIIAVLTSVFGQNPEKGVHRLTKLFWFICVPLGANLITDKKKLFQVLKAFSIGGFLVFIDVCIWKPIEVWRAMGEGGKYEDWRFVDALIDKGSMTDGEMLMLGVIVTLGVVFLVNPQNRQRVKWLVLLSVESLALLVNFKRGAWICAGILTSVFVAMKCGRKTLLWLMLAMNLVAWSPPAQTRFAQFADQFDPDTGARWMMWTKVAPKLVKAYPWGVGYGALTNRLMRSIYVHVEPGRSHLHSNPIQVLVECGWLGFLVYAGMMAHAIYNAVVCCWKTRPGPEHEHTMAVILLFMLLAILGAGLVEYNFGDTELLIVLSMIMGITSGAKTFLFAK